MGWIPSVPKKATINRTEQGELRMETMQTVLGWLYIVCTLCCLGAFVEMVRTKTGRTEVRPIVAAVGLVALSLGLKALVNP